jgi:protein involved in polysaccharide export with SLBB domain
MKNPTVKYLSFKSNTALHRPMGPVAMAILGVGLAHLAPAAIAATPAAPALPGAARPVVGSGPVTTDYVLGAGDVLDIAVTNHPDLNGSVIIRPDGKISFPRAGDVMAQGKTAKLLATDLERLLARTLNNARVSVLVKEANSNLARIIGGVRAPGPYTLRSGWRIVDLVGAAGGLSTKPSRISGRIIRGGRVIPLNISLAIQAPSNPANVLLKPNDLVVLDAANYEKQLSVAGSVARTGAYDLEEGLTVTALLAQAGGPLPTASLRNAYVLRQGQQLPLHLKAGMNSGVNFVFEPGDVLVVPENQNRFGVTGQVAKPAYYPLSETPGEDTLLQALIVAGGALANGDVSKLTITRTQDGQTKTLTVDANGMLSGQAPDNFQILPGDVIFVPEKNDQVHVVGQVQRPGAYPLKDGMNLISLLSEAGNQTPGAALSRAYVLRDGKQIPVDLRALLIDGRVDPAVAGFKLKNGDVLAIPDGSDQIHINGQVARPGPYNLDDGMTVYSLLSKAGNPLSGASLAQSYVLRDGQRIQMDLRSVLGVNPDPVLAAFQFEPGDTLVIPENPKRLAVLGQVARPGVMSFPENPADATILKVLTDAGGPLTGGQGANLAQAGILRKVDGKSTFIPVNLADLLKKGDKADVLLQPDDVLYLPAKGKSFSPLDLLGPASVLNTILK